VFDAVVSGYEVTAYSGQDADTLKPTILYRVPGIDLCAHEQSKEDLLDLPGPNGVATFSGMNGTTLRYSTSSGSAGIFDYVTERIS
jgi:hypothetical protein